jgi:hypothetical protein
LNIKSCVKPLGVNGNRRELFNVVGITLIYTTADSLEGISKSAFTDNLIVSHVLQIKILPLNNKKT